MITSIYAIVHDPGLTRAVTARVTKRWKLEKKPLLLFPIGSL